MNGPYPRRAAAMTRAVAVVAAGTLAACALAACSQERLARLAARTPDLPEDGANVAGLPPLDSVGLDDRQRDAIWLAHALAAYYPDPGGPQLDAATLPARTRALVSELDAVASEDDFAWRAALQRFLATLDDGHTSVSVPLYRDGDPVYSLAWVPDPAGKRLTILTVDSLAADRRALGAEVLRVGGLPADSIFALARGYHSAENRYRADDLLARREHLPRYYRAIGAPAAGDSLALVLRTRGGDTLAATLRPTDGWRAWTSGADTVRFPFARRQPQAFFTQYLPQWRAGYLQMNTSLDWAVMRPEVGGYVPFPLSLAARVHMRRQRSRTGALDFGRAVADFFRRAARDSLQRVILDVRHNGGGDERLGLQFAYYLADAHRADSLLAPETYYRFDELLRSSARGDYRDYRRAFAKTYGRPPAPTEWVALDSQVLRRGFWQGVGQAHDPLYVDASVPKFDGDVYVLTGPGTFSAASILAAVLQDNGLATVVGEPTGDSPSGPTGASALALPHTGTSIRISYLRASRPDRRLDTLDAVYPDVYAPRTYESLLRGGDPALEAALTAATTPR